MAVTGPIPLPNPSRWGDYSDILQSIIQNRQKKRELDMLEPLRSAQAQEAMAKASQSNMYSDLVKKALGLDNAVNENQSYFNNQSQQPNQQINNSTSSQSQLTNNQQKYADLAYKLGLLKQSPSEQQAMDLETARQKSLIGSKGASATETLKTISKSALGGLSVNASFDALDKMMDQPNYKNIAGTLEGKFINSQAMGLPTGAMLQSMFPNKFSASDANLAGQAEAHFGNIVTNVAERFKGPFKDMVRGVINSMKPNMGDSIAVQKGKIQTLKQLSKLADQQELLISKYVNDGMDSTQAILKASQELQPQLSNVISNQVDKTSQQSQENISKNKMPTRALVVEHNGKKYFHINGKWEPV